MAKTRVFLAAERVDEQKNQTRKEREPTISSDTLLRAQVKDNLLRDFTRDKIEFEPLAIINLNDLRYAYSAWLAERQDLQFAYPMSLDYKRLCLLDPKFRFKQLGICSTCGQRSHKDCCPAYSISNRSSRIFLINARIKSDRDTQDCPQENDSSTSDPCFSHSTEATPDSDP